MDFDDFFVFADEDLPFTEDAYNKMKADLRRKNLPAAKEKAAQLDALVKSGDAVALKKFWTSARHESMAFLEHSTQLPQAFQMLLKSADNMREEHDLFFVFLNGANIFYDSDYFDFNVPIQIICDIFSNPESTVEQKVYAWFATLSLNNKANGKLQLSNKVVQPFFIYSPFLQKWIAEHGETNPLLAEYCKNTLFDCENVMGCLELDRVIQTDSIPRIELMRILSYGECDDQFLIYALQHYAMCYFMHCLKDEPQIVFQNRSPEQWVFTLCRNCREKQLLHFLGWFENAFPGIVSRCIDPCGCNLLWYILLNDNINNDQEPTIKFLLSHGVSLRAKNHFGVSFVDLLRCYSDKVCSWLSVPRLKRWRIRYLNGRAAGKIVEGQ